MDHSRDPSVFMRWGCWRYDFFDDKNIDPPKIFVEKWSPHPKNFIEKWNPLNFLKIWKLSPSAFWRHEVSEKSNPQIYLSKYGPLPLKFQSKNEWYHQTRLKSMCMITAPPQIGLFALQNLQSQVQCFKLIKWHLYFSVLKNKAYKEEFESGVKMVEDALRTKDEVLNDSDDSVVF